MATIIQPQNPFLHFRSSKSTAPSSPLPSFPSSASQHQHYLPFTATAATATTTQPLLYEPLNPTVRSYPLSKSSTVTNNNIDSDNDTGVDIAKFFALLRMSVKYTDVSLAKAVHASMVKLQEEQNTLLGNPLISAYLKLGHAFYAYKVFTGLSHPNIVSFTSLISGFAKSSLEVEAIKVFFRMRVEGIEPNEHSFVAILTACIRYLELELGEQVHALIVKTGYLANVFVANALMGLYGKFDGYLDYVLRLFDEMPLRDIASWNTVISSLVKECKYEEAYELFCHMNRCDHFRVDYFTISSLLTACTGSFGFMEGRAVHAHAIRLGLEANLSFNNALIGFYTKCGSVKEMEDVFQRMPERDVITWTKMITAYMEFGLVDLAMEIFQKMPEKNGISYNALLAGFCKNGKGMEAVELFVSMVEKGLEITEFTLTSVINACGLLMNAKLSEQIHGFVMKFGSVENVCIESALLDMWTKCGRMVDAEKMFHQRPLEKDSSITWTSMLCGYARNGQLDDAISLFNQSQLEGTMSMDEVALSAVLGVCGTLGFHEMGKQIHCLVLKSGFPVDIGVGNSVISMYFKCHNMNDAIKAFNIMSARDIVSWNCLIAGHILHRQGERALSVWSRMEKKGIKPDAVSFVLIILAYRNTKTNMVYSCRKLFQSMKPIYNIECNSEHYASFVGVLGYWGLLEEAEETITNMPFEPKASVWRALLDACRTHSNTIIGKRVAKHILSMEPQDPSTYVLVSNLYSASGRWHNAETVREDMHEKGFKKHPSRSWIILNNMVHSFYARDKSHPQEKDIYGGLDILILECIKAGYVPDTSYVLHEVEEHQKKNFLFYHSAKLAATYGLLMTKPGKPVRVMKNILVCGDCHAFLKHVSMVTKREILLRDASGFHHFQNGKCSCGDCR